MLWSIILTSVDSISKMAVLSNVSFVSYLSSFLLVRNFVVFFHNHVIIICSVDKTNIDYCNVRLTRFGENKLNSQLIYFHCVNNMSEIVYLFNLSI